MATSPHELAVRDAFTSGGEMRAFEWPPLIESTISDVVFAGFAMFLLVGRFTRDPTWGRVDVYRVTR